MDPGNAIQFPPPVINPPSATSTPHSVNPPSVPDGSLVLNGEPIPSFSDTNAATSLDGQTCQKVNQNPLPISSLRTGFCYDIRMRFHQTVDYKDMHPEDPRRIYRIYKELALEGLIQDRETQSNNNDELMMRIRTRHATEQEILLIHTPEHLAEMKATESIPILKQVC